MKKKIMILFTMIMCVSAICLELFWLSTSKNKTIPKSDESSIINVNFVEPEDVPLPKPEITGGQRGEFGIDKNINETTIDSYLGRSDVVYRDMRMLEDPGNYEAIGGDRFLSGYIDGFEVVPFPYILPVKGLPSEVGETYEGTTLFYDDNGTYVANYEESLKIVEELFPKDKTIFLMCGGGGYAGMMKNFLISMGWDENKIYNVGGYWYYTGDHNIQVKKEENGKISYDFESVPYHDIRFDQLTKSTGYHAPTVHVTELKINTTQMSITENTSFLLNVIVLPNEASNKNISWISSDFSIASVDANGLVKGEKEGTAIITAESADGGKTISCEVTVHKSVVTEPIELDDLADEASVFNSLKLDEVERKFEDTVYSEDDDKYIVRDENGKLIDFTPAYYDMQNEMENEKLESIHKKADIFEKLLNERKTFILLVQSEECDASEYAVFYSTNEILDANHYPHFNIYATDYLNAYEPEQLGSLQIIKNSNSLAGSIVIIKDGTIYAYLDRNIDSLKNDDDTKNWLRRYIPVS